MQFERTAHAVRDLLVCVMRLARNVDDNFVGNVQHALRGQGGLLCGFSFGEIATMQDVSERTVQRDWEKARIYLHQALA